MSDDELTQHLINDHGINEGVARDIISGDEDYLRGFHDGMHGRVDADDLEGVGHSPRKLPIERPEVAP